MTARRSSAMPAIGAVHIQALLEQLCEHERTFLSHRDEIEPCRIFFIDSDVMSVFADGRPSDYVNSWPSLLSLTEKSSAQIDKQGDTAAEQLADTIGQAITRFLFGSFLKSLLTQRGRYYLTPEHSRELDGITLAIVREARSAIIGNGSWLDELQRLYVALSVTAQGATDITDSATAIVSHLATHSSMGRVSRTHALHTKFTVPLSSHIIAPPYRGDRPFILDTRPSAISKRVAYYTSKGFAVFLEGLKQSHPGSEFFFDIKRKVLSVHHPAKRMVEYLRAVTADEELTAAHELDALNHQAKIAAREVADVVSMARMCALAEHLQKDHPLAAGRRWEICMITGSTKLRDLHRRWRDLDGQINAIRIVHPLGFLRRAEFFDPDGARGVERRLREPLEDEYALRQMFVGDKGHSTESPPDPERFCESLHRSLVGIAARAVEEDRSLTALRLRLKHDENFNHARYVSAIRRSIAYFFLRAFKQINELAPQADALLPPASLPMLSLPRPQSFGNAASEEFFVRMALIARIPPPRPDKLAGWKKVSLDYLRERLTRGSSTTVDLTGLLKAVMDEDDTGYCTMLCLAVAYIAKGQSWVGAAETMASTAAMLALGGLGPETPTGNEALYLKAFLLRMTFSGNGDLGIWLDHHRTIMTQACEALAAWRRDEPDLATEPISSQPVSGIPSRYDMLSLRYRVEKEAGEVFVAIALIASTQNLRTDIRLNLIDLRQIVKRAIGLLRTWLPWSNIRVGAIHQAGRDFLASQLWTVVLESWLCASVAAEYVEAPLSDEELVIKEQAAELEQEIGLRLHGAMEQNMESLLLTMLAEVFSVRAQQRQHGCYGVQESDFLGKGFAVFDSEVRFPLLRRHWRG